MGANGLDEYWVPEHVKDYLRKLGFVLPLDDMEPWIRSWDDWMSARGEFYDYRDKDGMGRVYAVHRRSIHPAMRVCKEWGSLLLNEEVQVRALPWKPRSSIPVLGQTKTRPASFGAQTATHKTLTANQ